ncbi:MULTISPECIES: 50S ribosomal protein L24 [Daejeonella]|uniref:Large ribosomal subunit protein uL24 n=1 Tax=Daejeonella lutea TaxID=572036 RepID=A0A1T5C563_9SPHI|nr:50S ribosomal protein L24 [Daejeonella lutea]SKB54648.1 large subunit ribosomal protein L24 [Daejeonella lutea]
MEKKIKSQPKLKIRKGDLVQVTAGDSKGKQGKVLEVVLATNRVIVEGANMVSKHTKPNAATPNGGIVKKEASLHVSNVMVVDAKSGKPSRIGKQKNADGKSIRIAKKSGEEIK